MLERLEVELPLGFVGLAKGVQARGLLRALAQTGRKRVTQKKKSIFNKRWKFWYKDIHREKAYQYLSQRPPVSSTVSQKLLKPSSVGCFAMAALEN